MAKTAKTDLEQRALEAIAQYGVHMTLLRNAIAARMGVGVTDMECLRLLISKGTATPSELAKHTGLTSGATTAMLDRLEKAGLIERRRNPDDRRGTLIVLVKTTAENVRQSFASVRKLQDEYIAALTDSELQIITEFLEGFTKIWAEEIKQLQEES